MAESCCF